MIVGELGERNFDSGTASYTRSVLGEVYAERRKGNLIGVLEWSWNAEGGGSGWQCPSGHYGEGGPVLIRGYDGTPTVMGAAFRTWLLVRSSG